MKEELPQGFVASNVQAVGYSDLKGRPAFKMSIREHNGRWYLYTGHFWHSGWSIVDVTDPTAPQLVKFIPGPENTFTLQMELSDNIMITALEKIFPNFGGNPGKPFEEGVLIWDISDPVNPRKLGQFRTGGTGTHRNFYSGGRYVHLAAGMPGYDGNIYVIIDISDPALPVEAGRWWVPGQHTARGEKPHKPYISLHGPPYVVDKLAYLPYGSEGMVILDISDLSKPEEVSRLSFSPPFHSQFSMHSVLPLPEKGIAYVNSEDTSYGKGPLHHASIVDISDPSNPMLLSLFPEPVPHSGAPYRDFFEKGGWSGPHNINILQHNQDVQKQGELFYIAYFNAGLRVYNVEDPRLPVEVGYFMPPEPRKRYGPMPEGKLVMQTEDVLVDRRGFIYITDKNQGLWILKYQK
ncbi:MULTISPECIES: LVIVD repeat-containing protein [Methanobacterium]|jgi:hypothetical protein|uniref:LVIVD repeat protein n=1 Tax=Methanobacterium veterum TaxID=408577 RepID=A0A9E4ZX13_9EURY|nr:MULTISPECIES: hypothetical protein [Methanobacterium]MCZ3365568.1 hypothetical protein [Methanobacterium veterum]MCZ3373321.1 hypothetical protein [Methanobacterium veterum]